jgi:tetratricopeptide (TPR) repeat protein
LLRAAQTAVERRDLQRADALFLEYLAEAPDDAQGLGEYGVFCMRTGRAATACYLLYKANALCPGDVESLSQLGYARVELSDYDAARRSFESALALAPDNAMVNYGLALCEQHAGAWTAAAAAFTKALAAQSDAFPILLNLAEACHLAGDTAMARVHFEHAQRIAPNEPALWLAHGKFLRETGEPAQAMQLVDRCAALHPDEPKVVIEKARCLRTLGESEHAMRWLERLHKIAPGMPECLEEFGLCLDGRDNAARDLHWVTTIDMWIKTDDFALAESLLDRLLTVNPASAAGWNSRGIFESARHRIDAAEAAYRRAIEIDPSKIDASANLAILYENTNRVDAARTTAENAVPFIRTGERRSGAIELHLTLAKIARRQKDYARGITHLDQIDALAPNEVQGMLANFERGRIMDLIGDTSLAIAAFTRGNALAIAPWNRGNPGKNKALAGLDYMLDLVDKGWLREWKPIATLQPVPNHAFLIGFPRSGTTLLNHVLDGHDAIQAMEEKPPVQKIMDAVRSMPAGYPHALASFDALDVAYLRETYFRSAAEYGVTDPSKLLLDKFPMHTTLAGLLHRVFPQARFVFALRHPCDVVLSCFMQDFALNNTMANFCTLADTVAMYTRTMDLWQVYRQQLPLNVHTIRYEDVIDDFDGEVGALCDFLGVPWKDELRDFDAKALDRGRINTPSYGQVSRPIYREARYRWERYREQLAPYMPALQPYVERFGYSTAGSALPDRTT